MTAQEIRKWLEHLPLCSWRETNIGDFLLVLPLKSRSLTYWKTFQINEYDHRWKRFRAKGFYREIYHTKMEESFGPEFDNYENCWNLTQLSRNRLLPPKAAVYFSTAVRHI